MTDIIRERLENMANWAEERLNNYKSLKNDWYVRIGGNGLRAVSVGENSPLTGFADSSVKKWESVRKHFEPKTPPKDVDGKKEERRLQAFMIREALSHNMSLKHLICTEILGETYDDILFVFDEISLGDKNNPITFSKPIDNKVEGIIRCDLLCLAVKDGKGKPLLIELKYDRSLGRLIEQLEEFSYQISEEYDKEFEQLLVKGSGFEVDFSEVLKMMIWPALTSGKERKKTKDDLSASNVAVVEYQKVNSEDNLTEATFKSRKYHG